MYFPVDFKHQSVLYAAEVDHIAVNHVLPPELESEDSAVTEYFPCPRFRCCGVLPEGSCAVAFEEGNPTASRHWNEDGQSADG